MPNNLVVVAVGRANRWGVAYEATNSACEKVGLAAASIAMTAHAIARNLDCIAALSFSVTPGVVDALYSRLLTIWVSLTDAH